MIAEKYIPHIQKLTENEDPEIASFAVKVLDNTQKLINGEITLAEYNDGDYLIVFNSEFEHTKLGKTSINHIKSMIANGPNIPESDDNL